MAHTLFEQAIARIQGEYVGLGHSLGWRFLLTPARTLAAPADTLLLSFHPGGDQQDPAQGEASSEPGSAYLCESWHDSPVGQSPLQRQVQQLFEVLGENPDSTLSAYLVPFRAKAADEMPKREESRRFGVGLWKWLLGQLDPTLIVCLGVEVHAAVLEALGPPDGEAAYSVGWGAQTASLGLCGRSVVLRLPHLSQFKIFGRAEGAVPLARLFYKVGQQREHARALRRRE